MIGFADFKDLEQIAELEKRLIECAWTQKMHEDAFLTGNYKYFAIRDGGTVKAYSVVRIVLDEAELCNIAVSEDFRRRGAARELLEGVHCYCRSRGCGSVFLEVNVNNAAAVALYENCGYEKTGVRRNYYPSGDAVLMQKKLS